MGFTTIVIVFSAIVLLALLLIFIGRRGKVTGTHPHCRKCGFDLFGRPDGSSVCSECGADLSLPSAITTGQKTRRPALYASGILLLLLSLSTLAANQAILSNLATLWPHLPSWYVGSLLQSPDGPTAAAALTETERRLKTGSKNPTSDAALLKALLTTQADLNAIWTKSHSDLLSFARTAKMLTDAQHHQSIQQGLASATFHLTLPTRLRRGAIATLELHTTNARLPNDTSITLELGLTADSHPLLPERDLSLYLHEATTYNQPATPGRFESSAESLRILASLPTGPAQLRFTGKARIEGDYADNTDAPITRPLSLPHTLEITDTPVATHIPLTGPNADLVGRASLYRSDYSLHTPYSSTRQDTISVSLHVFGPSDRTLTHRFTPSATTQNVTPRPAFIGNLSVLLDNRELDITNPPNSSSSYINQSADATSQSVSGNLADVSPTDPTALISFRSNPRLIENALTPATLTRPHTLGILRIKSRIPDRTSSSGAGALGRALARSMSPTKAANAFQDSPLTVVDLAPLAAKSPSELLDDLSSPDDLTRNDTVWEVLRRAFFRTEIPAADRTLIVQRLLQIQADDSLSWNPQIGDILEELHTQSLLSPADWRKYQEQILGPESLTAITRPKTRRGSAVAIEATTSRHRVANATTLALWQSAAAPASNPTKPTEAPLIAWGAKPQPATGHTPNRYGYGSPFGRRTYAVSTTSHRPTTRPTTVTFDLTTRAIVVPVATPLDTITLKPDPASPALPPDTRGLVTATRTIPVTAELSNDPTVELLQDSAAQPAIERALASAITSLEKVRDHHHLLVEFTGDLPKYPTATSAMVELLLPDGTAIPIGSIDTLLHKPANNPNLPPIPPTFNPGGTNSLFLCGKSNPEVDTLILSLAASPPPTVTLRIRSSPEQAESTLDVTKVVPIDVTRPGIPLQKK